MKQFKTITITLIFLFTASTVSCYAESSELRKLMNKVFKCEQENATQKDMASMVELAHKVIEKNPKETGAAYYYLGEIYARTNSEKVRDYEKAMDCLQKSLHALGPKNKLRSFAHYNIGLLYYQGKGMEQNYDSAFVHFEKAQELNKSLIAGYAEMIEFGLGTNKDPGYALTCYEEGISAGEDLYEKAYALRYVIQHMINNDLNEEAYKNYQMYIITRSAKNDEKGSLKYLKASSDAGFAPAMCTYAGYLCQGELVRKKLGEAVRLYNMASDDGFAPSMGLYTSFVRQGELVEKNLEEAVRLYKVASDAGYLPAMHDYVGTYKLFDNSITLEEQFKLYKKSADLGFPLSQYIVGDFYYYGRGVKENFEEAYKWYFIAAKQGQKDAKRDLQCIGVNLSKERRNALEVEALKLPTSNKESSKLLAELSSIPTFGNDKSNAGAQKSQTSAGGALNASFYQSQYNKYSRKAERELKSPEPRADYLASLQKNMSSLAEQALAKGFTINRNTELEEATIDKK